MARSLPKKPNLSRLKNEAKSILKAHRRKDLKGCGILRNVKKFAAASDEKLFGAKVTLHDAQFALALEYGFKGWAALKEHLDGLARGRAAPGAPGEGEAEIEGVPDLSWGAGKDCTFIGALEAALAVIDHPVSYADMMGFTGVAFRARWGPGGGEHWCPSCAIGEMPEEEELIRKTTGWQIESDVKFGVKKGSRDATAEKIVASIDRGLPVVAYVSCLNMGTIFGYRDHGRKLLARDYDSPGPVLEWPAGRIGPMQQYLSEWRRPPLKKELLRESCALAVRNWNRKRGDGGVQGRKYTYGSLAFSAWVGDLRLWDSLSQRKRKQLTGISLFAFDSLLDARRSAVKYLAGNESLLGGAAAKSLAEARDIYRRELGGLLEPLSAEIGTIGENKAEIVANWSTGLQIRTAGTLEAAAKMEDRAIAALQAAVR